MVRVLRLAPLLLLLVATLALCAPASAGPEVGCSLEVLPASLAGEWEYAPLDAGECAGEGLWRPVQIPRAWTRGGEAGETGTGCYRTSFYLSRSVAEEPLGIRLPCLHEKQELRLNGAVIDSEPTAGGRLLLRASGPLLYALPASRLRLDDWNELGLLVPGATGRAGTADSPVVIDSFSAMVDRRYLGSLSVLAFCVFFLMVAANHLFLFLHRRTTRDNLWFALFALTTSLHLMSLDPVLVPRWLPPGVVCRLGVALLPLTVIFLESFVFAFFSIRMPLRARAVLAVMLLAGAAALVWPAVQLSGLVLVVRVASVVVGLEIAWLLLGCLRRRARHARAMAWSFGALALAGSWDLGVALSVLPRAPLSVGGVVAPVGFIPFYVTMGMILGHRYWQNFRDATTDRLTGLMQRHYFLQRLEVELERARRQRGNLVVAMIDLDGFKGVNDAHSHATGDRLLRGVAGVLRSRVRPFDLVGRYGGDELCLAMVVEDRQVALELLGRIRAAVAGHREPVGEESVGVTASIGAAMCEVCEPTDLDVLLEAADGALYRAKADGGNCVRTATPGLRRRSDQPAR